MQYRSKPVTAIRRTEDNLAEIKAQFEDLDNVMIYEKTPASIAIETLNGTGLAMVGDWIVRVGTEALCLSASEFEEHFEPVATDAPSES